jgi:hypothetical protein
LGGGGGGDADLLENSAADWKLEFGQWPRLDRRETPPRESVTPSQPAALPAPDEEPLTQPDSFYPLDQQATVEALDTLFADRAEFPEE